jgi:membrane associated rhomboid family serine protease
MFQFVPSLMCAKLSQLTLILFDCLLINGLSMPQSYFQVYGFNTSVLFHGSLLHMLFNMLALVPLGTELEGIMESVCLLFLMFLLATTNTIHLVIAF